LILSKIDPEHNLSSNGKSHFINKYFVPDSYNWKIIHARTEYKGGMMSELEDSYAQITMKYSTAEKEDNYIVFERRLIDNNNYLYWKIFTVGYDYEERPKLLNML